MPNQFTIYDIQEIHVLVQVLREVFRVMSGERDESIIGERTYWGQCAEMEVGFRDPK